MKIKVNEPLVKRNRTIGQIVTFASLGILAGGLIVSFTNADQIILSYGALIVGFLLSQVGIYFSSRWGRSPRPDEILTQSFKGLDDHFSIYHYSTPVSHLLLTPNSIWLLFPYSQKGKFTYQNGRYHHKGGSIYMKIFGQEGLGRPDLEIAGQIKDLTRFLTKTYDEADLPPIQPLLVFTNDAAEVEMEDAPYPGVQVKKMKEFVRKRSKDKNLQPEKFVQLQEILDN